MQPISLLGSTGSIGTQTLDICGEFSDRFDVVALAAGRNIELLAEQIKQFQPKLVGISNGDDVAALKELIKDTPTQPEIVVGMDGQCAVASHPDIEAVVTGIVGCAGLKPTCAAIEAGKDICLANKETLIAGGPAVLPLAAKHGVHILPADSEHSALFQCIQGMPEGGLRRIVLTASGGAFRDWPVEKLKDVTVCLHSCPLPCLSPLSLAAIQTTASHESMQQYLLCHAALTQRCTCLRVTAAPYDSTLHQHKHPLTRLHSNSTTCEQLTAHTRDSRKTPRTAPAASAATPCRACCFPRAHRSGALHLLWREEPRHSAAVQRAVPPQGFGASHLTRGSHLMDCGRGPVFSRRQCVGTAARAVVPRDRVTLVPAAGRITPSSAAWAGVL